jgi:hypothetical protein
MTDHSHLTEDERQLFVDGALPADEVRDINAHLARCADCMNDVARLRDIMARYKESSPSNAAVDELWPAIRSRIERDKVVSLGSSEQSHRRVTGRHFAAAGALAAGIVLTVVLLRPSHRIPVDTTVEVSDTSALQLVSDSVKSYEDETRVLLNRLEVQRAMMRPDAVASMDRDLKVIDSAIGELKVAIQNDPRNAALRQLLASSYRQKIELLKRANNAT